LYLLILFIYLCFCAEATYYWNSNKAWFHAGAYTQSFPASQAQESTSCNNMNCFFSPLVYLCWLFVTLVRGLTLQFYSHLPSLFCGGKNSFEIVLKYIYCCSLDVFGSFSKGYYNVIYCACNIFCVLLPRKC
jgi:hypothetical protein